MLVVLLFASLLLRQPAWSFHVVELVQQTAGGRPKQWALSSSSPDQPPPPGSNQARITTTTTTTTTESSSLLYNNYSVTVSYQGLTCTIPVASNETILAALERHEVAQRLSLPAAEMPFDCRRGNCLTCAAKWSTSSSSSSSKNSGSSSSSDHPHAPPQDLAKALTRIVRGEDGLSPTISNQIAELGYMLTCSSYVQGDGLELRLGENHVLWDHIYRQRLQSDETQLAARKAMARAIRKNAERHLPRWKRETENVLRKSGDV